MDMILENNLLTRLATGSSMLPRVNCGGCGHQLFRGFPGVQEHKCHSCKTFNFFDGEGSHKVYRVKPY